MLLHEMFDVGENYGIKSKPDENGNIDLNASYRDEKNDNSVVKLSDVRKTRLSLEHLNRLRMANDLRKVELDHELKYIKQQYSTPSDGGEMMGDMGGII